jgi:hypothetical protein
MTAKTPLTFEFLDKFPTEIRSIIFGYMISNNGEDQPVSYDAYDIPWPTLSLWNTQGLSIIDASHILPALLGSYSKKSTVLNTLKSLSKTLD